MHTATSTNTQLPVVAFAKGTYKNRFRGTTEFNRPGHFLVFKAQYLAKTGWVFFGHAIDADWQLELKFNADPSSMFVIRVEHSDVRSQPVDDLVMAVSEKANCLTNEDGFRFASKTASGAWFDGDIEFHPDFELYEEVGATLEIVQSNFSDAAFLEVLTKMGFEECTLPTGMPGLRLSMPAGGAVLISCSMLGLGTDLNGQGVQLLAIDGGGGTLYTKTCQAGNFIETVRDACKGMYTYGLELLNRSDLVAECKSAVDRHLQSRLGFASQRAPTFAMLSLNDDLADYIKAFIDAGHAALEPQPDAGEVLEIATMKALGWQEADGYTKDQIEGARYMRVFGGNGSPFAYYSMTIAETPRGWLPFHGSVAMSPVANPVEAAHVLTQYWTELPNSTKVTHQYAQSVRNP